MSGGFCAALFAWLVVSNATPREPLRVLLFVDDVAPPTLARLETELLALALEPVRAPRVAMLDAPTLQAMAREAGAQGAVVLSPSLEAARVWVIDRHSGAAISYDVHAAEPGGEEREALVVLLAVEIVRARLLEVARPMQIVVAPPPTPQPVPIAAAPPTELQPVEPQPPIVELTVGPTVVWSPGGPNATAQIGATAARALHRWLALGLSLSLPAYPAVIERNEGRAELWQSTAAASVRVPFAAPDSTLQTYAGLGVTALLLITQGRANPPSTDRTNRGVGFGPSLHAGGRWRVSERWAVRSEAAMAVTLSKMVVRFAERRVSSLGRPALAFSIGVDVAL